MPLGTRVPGAPTMAEERVQRKLAAILAADVVGYSRMMRDDETGTLTRLKALRNELLDPKISDYGGRIVKTTGDGMLIEFASAVDAVQHALDVQDSIERRVSDLPADQRIRLRIGINVGDVIVDGDDLFGDGVNVAVRLEGLAETGGTCISSSVYEQVRHKIELVYDDLGEQAVKNIAEPVHVFRVESAKHSDSFDTESRRTALFRRPAVAVLPFENLSGDPEQEFFADGLTEDIITALSLWRTFPVIARNSTYAYKGKSPDIRKIGEELGARYVVEGSVRKVGNRVRVTAQLINAQNGHHVWAERYDRELNDIFAVQDELTQRVAAMVTPELERAEQRHRAQCRPQELDAWGLVQSGFSLLREFTPDGNSRARGMFERAIEIDPGYSRAYSGLAYTFHRDLAFQFFSTGDVRGTLAANCLSAAQRAVDLDQSDSIAHTFLGLAKFWCDDFDGAVLEEEKAVELNPSNAVAYVGLGSHLTVAGRPDEAIPFIEQGLQLNPNDPRNHVYTCFMAHAHLVARRHAEAADWARRAIQRRPDFPMAYMLLAASLGHLGELDNASAALANCERLQPGYLARGRGWLKHANKADDDHIVEGLRTAGWLG
jgi:adenylate cyclase